MNLKNVRERVGSTFSSITSIQSSIKVAVAALLVMTGTPQNVEATETHTAHSTLSNSSSADVLTWHDVNSARTIFSKSAINNAIKNLRDIEKNILLDEYKKVSDAAYWVYKDAKDNPTNINSTKDLVENYMGLLYEVDGIMKSSSTESEKIKAIVAIGEQMSSWKHARKFLPKHKDKSYDALIHMDTTILDDMLEKLQDLKEKTQEAYNTLHTKKITEGNERKSVEEGLPRAVEQLQEIEEKARDAKKNIHNTLDEAEKYDNWFRGIGIPEDILTKRDHDKLFEYRTEKLKDIKEPTRPNTPQQKEKTDDIDTGYFTELGQKHPYLIEYGIGDDENNAYPARIYLQEDGEWKRRQVYSDTHTEAVKRYHVQYQMIKIELKAKANEMKDAWRDLINYANDIASVDRQKERIEYWEDRKSDLLSDDDYNKLLADFNRADTQNDEVRDMLGEVSQVRNDYKKGIEKAKRLKELLELQQTLPPKEEAEQKYKEVLATYKAIQKQYGNREDFPLPEGIATLTEDGFSMFLADSDARTWLISQTHVHELSFDNLPDHLQELGKDAHIGYTEYRIPLSVLQNQNNNQATDIIDTIDEQDDSGNDIYSRVGIIDTEAFYDERPSAKNFKGYIIWRTITAGEESFSTPMKFVLSPEGEHQVQNDIRHYIRSSYKNFGILSIKSITVQDSETNTEIGSMQVLQKRQRIDGRYVYKIGFLLETDTNTTVYWLDDTFSDSDMYGFKKDFDRGLPYYQKEHIEAVQQKLHDIYYQEEEEQEQFKRYKEALYSYLEAIGLDADEWLVHDTKLNLIYRPSAPYQTEAYKQKPYTTYIQLNMDEGLEEGESIATVWVEYGLDKEIEVTEKIRVYNKELIHVVFFLEAYVKNLLLKQGIQIKGKPYSRLKINHNIDLEWMQNIAYVEMRNTLVYVRNNDLWNKRELFDRQPFKFINSLVNLEKKYEKFNENFTDSEVDYYLWINLKTIYDHLYTIQKKWREDVWSWASEQKEVSIMHALMQELSLNEKEFVNIFWWNAIYNTQADAVRHAYINALSVKYMGYKIATEVWNRHEYFNGNPENEMIMDLFNNSIGRSIGLKMQKYSDQEILQFIIDNRDLLVYWHPNNKWDLIENELFKNINNELIDEKIK